MVPKMALIRENGGLDVRFYVRDPKKAHPWAERRVLAYFASKIRPGPLAVASCKNPQKNGKTNTFLLRKVTHAQRRNVWADRD